MTDQELAHQLFPQEHHGSSAAASLLTGTALAASSNGQVLILVDGATGGSVDAGVLLPTTLSVVAGENVIITLYGVDGHGKKAIVTGKVGESSGGGDISALENRVSVLEGEYSSLSSTVAGQTSSISAIQSEITRMQAFWSHHHLSSFSDANQLTGPGIWKVDAISGTVRSRWSGSDVGDYTGILHDFNGDTTNGCHWGTMLMTSPRSTSLWELRIWDYHVINVRAI